MAKKAKAPVGNGDTRVWNIEVKQNEQASAVMARKLNAPFNRHGLTACVFQGQIAQGLAEADRPNMLDFALDLRGNADAIASGDLTLVSHLLASQALTLDAIFTEMARRSGHHMADYLDASERYMRLALKAQANSRATLEALAKLHQPREQTVRHVHVNEGGQAVIADQIHHLAGGRENGKSSEQPHAQSPLGPAMLGHDAQGNGMPIPSDQRREAVPNARGQGKRRAQGQ